MLRLEQLISADRLPPPLALPIIGVLSLALWAAIIAPFVMALR